MNKKVCIKCRENIWKKYKGDHPEIFEWTDADDEFWNKYKKVACLFSDNWNKLQNTHKIPQKCPFKLEHIVSVGGK